MGREVRRIPPRGRDHAHGFRNHVERQIHWHPPLVRPDVAALREPAAVFVKQKKHPRAHLVAADPSTRLMYSCQIWDATKHKDREALPACDWCGMPTGNFCNGIAATERQPGFDCTVALCSVCDKLLDLCVNCTAWCGTPTTTDERIDFKEIRVRRHEVPGIAIEAMLQGRPVPHGSMPRSWLVLRDDVSDRNKDHTQIA